MSRHHGRTRTTRLTRCSVNKHIARPTFSLPMVARLRRPGDTPTKPALTSRRAHLLSLTGTPRGRCKSPTLQWCLRSCRGLSWGPSHFDVNPLSLPLSFPLLAFLFLFPSTLEDQRSSPDFNGVRGGHWGDLSWAMAAERFCFCVPDPSCEAIVFFIGKDTVGCLRLSNVLQMRHVGGWAEMCTIRKGLVVQRDGFWRVCCIGLFDRYQVSHILGAIPG